MLLPLEFAIVIFCITMQNAENLSTATLVGINESQLLIATLHLATKLLLLLLDLGLLGHFRGDLGRA